MTNEKTDKTTSKGPVGRYLNDSKYGDWSAACSAIVAWGWNATAEKIMEVEIPVWLYFELVFLRKMAKLDDKGWNLIWYVWWW